ncbi:nitroreductase family protein [Patellaria atrata CBS 101060]|uniref:Nitroreductase family protein n=1 Tax=Patellaria atrata CBS 101060 TaxID=1346257 RepID=A0A9P4S3L3_9PEZI|nr:nitroreductase family protein [Patellaria atrata CBS 101060]
MGSSNAFFDAVKTRRTYYQLNKDIPISDDRIAELVKDTVLHVPSSFNSQSARLVVLLKDEHDKFWDFAKEVLKPMVPPEAFGKTEQKLNGFKAGYGTILFYEAPEPVNKLMESFPLYSDKFPQWSEHTSAMHQFALWVGLEAEGLGANLQHYNPVVDQKVQLEWNVPQQWQLKAQLVFGGRAGRPGEKTFQPVEERMFVHGK